MLTRISKLLAIPYSTACSSKSTDHSVVVTTAVVVTVLLIPE